MKPHTIALALLLTGTSANADIIYTFDITQGGHAGSYTRVVGSLTTDGTLGTLTPNNVLGWDISTIELNHYLEPPEHTSGTAITFTSGSLTATVTAIDFYTTPLYTSQLSFGGISYSASWCGQPCGMRFIAPATGQFYSALSPLGQSPLYHFTIATAVIPGPEMGAGLASLLVLASLTLLMRSRFTGIPC